MEILQTVWQVFYVSAGITAAIAGGLFIFCLGFLVGLSPFLAVGFFIHKTKGFDHAKRLWGRINPPDELD